MSQILQYDVGMQEDFDNMTQELGLEITIKPRLKKLDYDTFEHQYDVPDPLVFGALPGGIGFPIPFSEGCRTFGHPPAGIGFPIVFYGCANEEEFTEIAFIQPLLAEHQVVQAGEFDIGDIRCTFKSDSSIQEGYFIFYQSHRYKIQNLTKVKGLINDSIAYIKAFGVRQPLK